MKYNVEQPEVYEAVKAAVSEGLEIIRGLEAQNKYIGRYIDFPKMSWFESGLPNFSFSFLGEGPTDYKAAFDRDVPVTSIKSWSLFLNLIPKYPALRRYYGWKSDEGPSPANERKLFTDLTIKALIDRYIHISKKTDLDEEMFSSVYVEWERSVFLDDLYFDVFVPLIYITFDSDAIDFGEGIAIEKIPELIQLARIKKKSHQLSRYESVTGSATHALVLKNWRIPNMFWFERASMLSRAEAFSDVIDKIDLFLAALRTATGAEMGYNQLVVVPKGWGDLWEAHLPDVEVVTLKAYPEHFESGGWLEKPPVISSLDCEKAFGIYKSIENNKSNKLLLATRRLNTAYLRRSEDDAILDVTIGLESLLADDSRSEIIYRLAVRLASLTVIERFDGHEAADVFALCKKIYDYRSAVAHGSHETHKKRVIRVKSEADPVPAVMLGLSLLRYAIRIMSMNLDLLDTKKLDQHLLKQLATIVRDN